MEFYGYIYSASAFLVSGLGDLSHKRMINIDIR
jgi:hypothetical protein